MIDYEMMEFVELLNMLCGICLMMVVEYDMEFVVVFVGDMGCVMVMVEGVVFVYGMFD